MILAYVSNSDPEGLLRKNNFPLWKKVIAQKKKLGILGAEEFLGIHFPYTGAEYRNALEAVFPSEKLGRMSDDERALYYAVQDFLRDDGIPHGDILRHTVEDEDWLRERYGDEYYEEHYGTGGSDEEGSYLPLIRSLSKRRHMTTSRRGHVYDTGIRGTLLSFPEDALEDFLYDLSEHGPFAFILDEPSDGIYNIECTDSPYFIFNDIWEKPFFSENAYISKLQSIDHDDLQVEYMIASTIQILERFGFEYDEVEEFLLGNPEDYADGVSWYMVNHYQTAREDPHFSGGVSRRKWGMKALWLQVQYNFKHYYK